jgi:serine/threonine-protein kinase
MKCPTCQHDNAANAKNCAACGAPVEAAAQAGSTPGVALPAGTKLQNGGYTVGKVLGQGGFGLTYKAGDMALRRFVAIKEFFPAGSTRNGATVTPSHTTQADVFARSKTNFVREASVLARFNHPGIVRVFSVFEENNSAYMVMEFLEGQTLGERLQEKGALPEAEATQILRQIGEALKAVHGTGLLHRDLKPDNIFLAKDGRAILIDFGTAREFAVDKTRAMTRELTPGYAPLEQYSQQARFGPYTDVYALGATIYHCLTGDAPPSSLDRATGVEIKPPEQVNPHISRAASEAILWALQPQAPARPQTIEEFLAAFEGKIAAPPQNATPQNAPTQNYTPRASASAPTTLLPAGSTPPPLSPKPPPAASDFSDIPPAQMGSMWGNGVANLDFMDGVNIWSILAILILTVGAIIGVTRCSTIPEPAPATVAVAPENAPPIAPQSPSPAAPPPVPSAPSHQMDSGDAYDAACEFVRDRLNRPSSADFLPESDTHCSVLARGDNRWKIESGGMALDSDGDRFYFSWEADIDFDPVTDNWHCISRITDVDY